MFFNKSCLQFTIFEKKKRHLQPYENTPTPPVFTLWCLVKNFKVGVLHILFHFFSGPNNELIYKMPFYACTLVSLVCPLLTITSENSGPEAVNLAGVTDKTVGPHTTGNCQHGFASRLHPLYRSRSLSYL